MNNKIINIVYKMLLNSLIILFFIVTISFTIRKNNNIICKRINIFIRDSADVKFVSASDILEILKNKNISIINQKLHSLPIYSIEQILKNIPSVKNAEVYTTIDSTLTIEITQRKPIVRIITDNFFSFYIDNEGYIFPISNNYTAHTLIASGYIRENIYSYNTNNVNEIDSITKIKKTRSHISEIYKIAKAIYNDSLMNPLISQIYYNTAMQIELTPIIGKFNFIIGDTTSLNEKLKKISIFYKEIYPRLDSTYRIEKVNLMFKNQIVCKKINTTL
ncbi:MAG: hypothetical protein N3A01_03100 [Bacteroidales bacterium]|nr:hypothetical protein [Bacteroidales bacterium]